ncbi:uncharacterized protein LOC123554414 [Mercenaria mercenaria]|uniref:uncharacterized protein LOC123554414 n=1 Tax=Mercenaria mercenaria TaxID=6596 RepID=UPI00234F99DE|nr:uncharacterized protein LOC123554414 [Mercenaria mercenaria]
MGRNKDEEDDFSKLRKASAVILLVVGLIGFGLAKLAVGANNLNNCSIEKHIPVYILLSAFAPLALSGCFACQGNGDLDGFFQLVCGCITLLFSFAWLICGTVWVYPNYGIVMSKDFKLCKGNETDGCSEGDCDKSLLRFAFAVVTIDWMILLIGIGLVAWFIHRENN